MGRTGTENSHFFQNTPRGESSWRSSSVVTTMKGDYGTRHLTNSNDNLMLTCADIFCIVMVTGKTGAGNGFVVFMFAVDLACL